MAILFALQVNLTAPICVGLCGHLHIYVHAVYVCLCAHLGTHSHLHCWLDSGHKAVAAQQLYSASLIFNCSEASLTVSHYTKETLNLQDNSQSKLLKTF